MGMQPAGLLSWSGAKTFRALISLSHSLAVTTYAHGASGARRTRRTSHNLAKSLGWAPRAGLLSWRGASTFRALIKRNTCLAVARTADVPSVDVPSVTSRNVA